MKIDAEFKTNFLIIFGCNYKSHQKKYSYYKIQKIYLKHFKRHYQFVCVKVKCVVEECFECLKAMPIIFLSDNQKLKNINTISFYYNLINQFQILKCSFKVLIFL
jgi:hypothetical protein